MSERHLVRENFSGISIDERKNILVALCILEKHILDLHGIKGGAAKKILSEAEAAIGHQVTLLRLDLKISTDKELAALIKARRISHAVTGLFFKIGHGLFQNLERRHGELPIGLFSRKRPKRPKKNPRSLK